MTSLSAQILKAGALVGTLDILAAFTYFSIKTGKNPLVVLNYIASALFGKQAFTGGVGMQAIGLIMHYIIAFGFTLFFFWVYSKFKALANHRLLAGILYGVFVWAVMNLIVVPMSKIPARPFDLTDALINALILIVCMGIPLSFIAAAFYRKQFHQEQQRVQHMAV